MASSMVRYKVQPDRAEENEYPRQGGLRAAQSGATRRPPLRDVQASRWRQLHARRDRQRPARSHPQRGGSLQGVRHGHRESLRRASGRHGADASRFVQHGILIPEGRYYRIRSLDRQVAPPASGAHHRRGRLVGIAAGIAARLADDGWDLALSYWRPYDADRAMGVGDDEPERLADDLRERGATVDAPARRPRRPGGPGSAGRRGRSGARPAARPRALARRVAGFLDPRHDRRVLRPAHERERPGELAAHRRLRPAGEGRRRHRRPHQRPHRLQPPVRRVEGRARPHRRSPRLASSASSAFGRTS